MEVMVESLHYVIDQLAGVLLTLLGEMEIEHGGFELGMAQVALDDAQVDAGFEEVGGVGMAQGMDGNSLFSDACIKLGTAKGALDATFAMGLRACLAPVPLRPRAGKTRRGWRWVTQ